MAKNENVVVCDEAREAMKPSNSEWTAERQAAETRKTKPGRFELLYQAIGTAGGCIEYRPLGRCKMLHGETLYVRAKTKKAKYVPLDVEGCFAAVAVVEPKAETLPLTATEPAAELETVVESKPAATPLPPVEMPKDADDAGLFRRVVTPSKKAGGKPKVSYEPLSFETAMEAVDAGETLYVQTVTEGGKVKYVPE